MKFLITGAGGGLGGEVRRMLEAEGHEIYAWRHDDGAPLFLHGVDGAFHAAGKVEMIPLRSHSKNAFDDAMFSAMMFSAILSYASKGGVKEGGSIVAMSSVAAVCGTPGMALYAASKGAIESMVRSAAVELAGRKIRVNAIRAGAFTSPMHDRITQRLTPPQVDDYRHRHPLGFGSCDDVAKLAVAMLTGYPWMTGSIVTMDGGYSAK